ncbi:unnamed protein product [Parnassius apollo]|uniref:(apollo) hypothetical protein n=1 Tax=Parnassius apollo TaxID=110799 RepID=A0A8S3XK01_PARAO|nr:unnamed protein product [Parnassius apollo]
MEETHVLLNKVTYHLTPIGCPVLLELDIFHMQVILCKTTFAPLDVFTLDRSLMVTVITTLVTFVVFIKQYSVIDECK